MTKTEFLAASLPYNLKVKMICGDGVYDTTNKLTIKNLYEFGISRFKPIIRPLDSLIKECVQADYNDGKPFVPIVDLAKMIIDLPDHNPYMQYNSVSAELHTDNSIFIIHKDRFTLFERDEYRIITCPKQLQLFQQMLKWHFWPNMPENEEVVYVNENFNPYK